MSHLVRLSNQVFRRGRRSIENGLYFRRLNYSQKPTGELVVSRKKTFLFTALFGVAATGFYYYVQQEKDYAAMRERRKALKQVSMGGDWELIDTNGKQRTSEDFKGKWCMIYFGFTHCPDICPDEMEKMAAVVDGLDKIEIDLQPLFITIDPDRDTKEVIGKYVGEFSPKIIGMTGTMDQIKNVCHSYNVYFKAGPKDVSNDYIVDHTIILYLIDPTGQFVDYYGTSKTPDEIIASVQVNMNQWKKLNNDKNWFTRLLS